MRLKTLTASVLAATVGSVLLALPAEAVSWGTLTATYKNQARSQSSGTFYNDRAVYATVFAWINDPSNDGNNAYTDADEYFWESSITNCGGASYCWVFDRTKQGPEYNYFNTPTTFYMYNSLHNASRARALIHTCAQLGWPVPDSCSPNAIVTFDY